MTTTDTTAAALDYLARGYHPIPLPAGQKYPPPDGLTGYRGRNLTANEIAATDWTGNIGIRLPPTAIGLDVDAYKGGTLQQLEDRLGPLPATVWSTSRDDGSGIALFRVPAGTTLTGTPADAIEAIQAHHRYMVVWPSIHPATNLPYRWVDEASGEILDTPPDTNDLPELPWAWIEALSVVKGLTGTAATPDETLQFIGTTATATATTPGRLRGIQNKLDNRGGASRHDTLVTVACWAMREAAAGCYTSTDAINLLETWWRTVMDDPRRIDNGELEAAIAWAIGQANADPARIAAIRNEQTVTTPTVTPPAQPPGNVNPETGEILNTNPGCNLPDEFWLARPELAQIRQAAHSRLVAADATLIAVLARAITLVPPSVTLPPIVGGSVSLNLFGSIVDPSGGGKSAAVSVARQLVPIVRKDIVDPILPSSGEGLIEAFMGWQEEEGDDGKKRKERRQVHTAGFAWVDEGQGLLAQADRSGSTIMETIRSGWMGGDLGQHNASEDRKRWLREHRYRLCMIVGFQLAYAAHLIGDAVGGTPQRFTFMLGTDPALIPGATDPGPLHLERWPSTGPTDLDVAASVQTEIRERRIGRSRGELVVDPLDTHADLRRLKLAAALAVLNGRLDVTVDDWELAGIIDNTSCAVRTLAVHRDQQRSQAEHATALRLAVERSEAVDVAKVRRSTEAASRSIAKRVWRDGAMTLAAAWRHVGSHHRDNSDREEAYTVADDRGWLTVSGQEIARGPNDPR